MSYSHAYMLPQYQDSKKKTAKDNGKKKRTVKTKISPKAKISKRPMQGNYNVFY
jgi:hypothetical protein